MGRYIDADKLRIKLIQAMRVPNQKHENDHFIRGLCGRRYC